MSLTDNLGQQLDASQLEAVTSNDGPLLVIAGAGSGKTRVLTYKIAYLISQGYNPWNILALTFTNKAAREMNERIAAIMNGADIRGLWSGTFHSIFARILRTEAERIGFPQNFTIYDAADSKSLLKTIVKEQGLDEKVYKPALIAGRISDAKNRIILPDDYARSPELLKRDKMDNIGATHIIYNEYVNRLRRSNAMDFDDLLLNTFLLLRDNDDIRRKYLERFKYILVDEYQDTNHLQHQIVRLLTTPDSCLCVVGDDAQSIYGFRGANIDNILQFQSAYPKAKLVKLERNYRSTQNIVNAANNIISKNRRQIPKVSFSNNDAGERLRFRLLNSDREEAERITMEIVGISRRNGLSLNDMAVLYRTNAQSRAIEEALRNSGVPYRIYGGLSFYQRKEVKDCIAFFRLVNNTNDEESLRRIINYPTRGIGDTTIKKIQQAALSAGVSMWEVLCNPLQHEDCKFNKGTLSKLSAFATMIESFRNLAPAFSAYALAAHIVAESGITADLSSDKTPEGISKKENVEELLNSIMAFEQDAIETNGEVRPTLSDFLSQVSLLTDTDEKDDTEEKVTLMTIHAAKGLEFDTVFVAGMEDNLFPNANARFIPKEMEEERRLFYVAVTRAKQRCILTASKCRFKYGQMEFSDVSPFVKEIDKKFLDDGTPQPAYHSRPQTASHTPTPIPAFHSSAHGQTEVTIGGKRFSKVSPTSSPSVDKANDYASLVPGTKINHERFGIGRVLQLESSGADTRAIVEFENNGVKKLLLKFARFEVI